MATEKSPSSRRAWIEIFGSRDELQQSVSPSSRRAWIEISSPTARWKICRVALLAEGVDRNISWVEDAIMYERSPSSRRAWIEIGHPG